MDSTNKRALSKVLQWLCAGLIITVAGSLLSRTRQPLPTTRFTPGGLAIAYGGMLAAAVAAVWWSRALVRPTPAAGLAKHSADPAPEPLPAGPAELPPDLVADPFVQRIQRVLGDGDAFLAPHPMVRKDDQFEQFAVGTRKAGGFATERDRNSMYQRLSASLGGHWTMTARLEQDLLIFDRKSGFPSLITPPVPSHVPRSPSEALSMYKQFRLKLGVGAGGEQLLVDPAKFPHSVVVGGTGSGKSVFNRALIEDYRTAGWMIMLADGKLTDFEGLHGQPNIVTISQTTADHVRLARMVRQEVESRQFDAKMRKRSGEANPFVRPPLLFLLDEYASIRANVETTYGDVKPFEGDLEYITRIGREFKVHVVFSTQELYRKTMNGTLLGNIGLIVSLGPPEDKTIKEAFPDALAAEAARVGGTISKKDRGRGIALFSDDKGNASVVEFQSYFGYSPANSDPAPTPQVEADWVQYKTQASDQVPKLYPRIWWAVQDADYGEDLETLYATTPIVLDGTDGTTHPDRLQYDPLSEIYNGQSESDGSSMIPSLAELDDYVPPAINTRTAGANTDEMDYEPADTHAAGPEPEEPTLDVSPDPPAAEEPDVPHDADETPSVQSAADMDPPTGERRRQRHNGVRF